MIPFRKALNQIRAQGTRVLIVNGVVHGTRDVAAKTVLGVVAFAGLDVSTRLSREDKGWVRV